MPDYDPVAVNSHYSGILQSEALYFQIMQLMSAGHIPEKRKIEGDKVLDRYIYWASIAKIHVFHGRWAESEAADLQSRDALMELITILQTDAI